MISSARLTAIGLVLLSLLAYSNSFHTGFPLDNKALILDDARVHDATAANVKLILDHTYWWPRGESGLYRPLTTLSYLFNYAVLGNRDRPQGYHRVNVAVHAANVLLVYALALQLLAAPLEAAAVAAVWAVLPLSTEAVTNIVGRADLLAAFGVLGGLLAYLRARSARAAKAVALRADARQRAEGRAKASVERRWFAPLALTAFVGVFSKESAVALAGVILLYEWLHWEHRRSVRALAGAAAALALPFALMAYQRASVLSAAPAAEFPFVDNPIVGADFWTGRLTAVKVLAHYLRLVVWPSRLSPDYSYAQIPLASGTPQDWFAWLTIATLAVALVFVRRRLPRAFFFASFAFVTLLPASNLLFASGTIMAERLMYLPSVGVVGVLVTAIFAAARATNMRSAAYALLAAAVAGGAARTWTRNRDWQDDVTLWTSAERAAPANYKAHLALAEALYAADPGHSNIDRVIAEAEHSIAILAPLPDARSSFHAYRQAGAYYLDKGGSPAAYQRALALLTRAAAIDEAVRSTMPTATTATKADVYRLLAAAYLGLKDAPHAVDAAAQARALEPGNALAYRLSAAASLAAGRPDEGAITLMTGSMLTGDTGLTEELLNVYRGGLDREGCAVLSTPTGPILNPSCAIVHAHVCAAVVGVIDASRRMGRPDRAGQFRAAAVRDFNCSAESLPR